MKSALLTVKIDPKVKQKAQKVANDLGFSLSSLVDGYLKQLIRNKSVFFSSKYKEPSEYLIQALKESEADRKAGRVSPQFDNAKDAIAWLNDPDRRYENEIQ